MIQTVQSFQKFKENFHEKIKPWAETDDYRGLKEANEQFEEIYNKLVKASKKQFKKIAVEGIETTMNEISRLYTNVGCCRESEYDIDFEDLDY